KKRKREIENEKDDTRNIQENQLGQNHTELEGKFSETKEEEKKDEQKVETNETGKNVQMNEENSNDEVLEKLEKEFAQKKIDSNNLFITFFESFHKIFYESIDETDKGEYWYKMAIGNFRSLLRKYFKNTKEVLS